MRLFLRNVDEYFEVGEIYCVGEYSAELLSESTLVGWTIMGRRLPGNFENLTLAVGSKMIRMRCLYG
jgi:hypothetical protein